jgi:hypothetical protein
VAVVLFFFLVALVVVVVALLVMAVGGTLASVGACLLLRDAVCGRAPDPVGLTLLVGGAATFVTPVLLGVGLYLAG